MSRRLLILLLLLGSARAGGQARPPATRSVTAADTMHGVVVPDPFRWLENTGSAETRRWTEAQDAFAERWLAARPVRERFRRRLTELANVPRVSGPVTEAAGRTFWLRNTGLQRNPSVIVRDAAGTRVLVDTDRRWPDGMVSVADFAPSPDGARYAYVLARAGSGARVAQLADLRTSRPLPDSLPDVRPGSISWTRDGEGFFYSRGAAGTGLWYHAAGTAQSRDRSVLAVPDDPAAEVTGRVSDDGRGLFVTVRRGVDVRNRLLVADLVDARRPNVGAVPAAVFDTADARYEPLGVANGMLYVLTDRDAPRRRIVAVRAGAGPQGRLTSIVPERALPIAGAVLLRDRLVVHALQGLRSRLFVMGLDGRAMGEIALPDEGTVQWMSGRQDGTVLHFAFTSPLHPVAVLRWGGSGAPAALEGSRMAFDPLPFETRHHTVVAADGARIPVSVTAPKRVARDSSRAAWLAVSGSLGVTRQPAFTPAIPAWLETGGIWVTAHVRGGGEPGEDWHRAGMREGKRLAVDDAIAVAEWLVREGYTTHARLTIAGERHDAVLVAAAMQRRPELFGSAIVDAGPLDLVRFERLPAGAGLESEYGSPRDRAAFEWLRALSPVHNAKRGACHPRTLATVAEGDETLLVAPVYKFVATMQGAQGCEGAPVLLRVRAPGEGEHRAWADRLTLATP